MVVIWLSDPGTMNEYAGMFPDEVRALFAALSDPANLGIIAVLSEDGKMTFNEMKDKFQISTGALHDRLTALQNGNLVRNFYLKSDKPGFSYYDITDIADQMLKSVYRILYPLKPPQQGFENLLQSNQASVRK